MLVVSRALLLSMMLQRRVSDTMALRGECSPCTIDVGDVVDLGCIVEAQTWRNFEVL